MLHLKNVLKNENIMYKIKMKKRNGEMEKMRKSQQTFETVERERERELYFKG